MFTQYAASELSVPALVLGTIGGQGYFQVQHHTLPYITAYRRGWDTHLTPRLLT